MNRKGYILINIIICLFGLLSIVLFFLRIDIFEKTNDILKWISPSLICFGIMLIIFIISYPSVKQYENNRTIEKIKNIEFTKKEVNININDLENKILKDKYKKISDSLYRKYHKDNANDEIRLYQDNVLIIEQKNKELINLELYTDRIKRLDEVTTLCFVFLKSKLDFHLMYFKQNLIDINIKKDIKEVYPVIIYDNHVYYLKYGIINRNKKWVTESLKYLDIEYE